MLGIIFKDKNKDFDQNLNEYSDAFEQKKLIYPTYPDSRLLNEYCL